MENTDQTEPVVGQSRSREPLLLRFADAFLGPKVFRIPISEACSSFLIAANIPDRLWIADVDGEVRAELATTGLSVNLWDGSKAVARKSDFWGYRVVLEDSGEGKQTATMISPVTRLRRALLICLFGLAVSSTTLISSFFEGEIAGVVASIGLLGMGVLGLVGLRRGHYGLSAWSIFVQLSTFLTINLYGLVFWLGAVSTASRLAVIFGSVTIIFMMREIMMVSRLAGLEITNAEYRLRCVVLSVVSAGCTMIRIA